MTGTLKNWQTGFIGLGLMGRPMCLNLLHAGAELTVYNRTPAVAEAIQQPPRLTAVRSVAELAQRVNIVILMVADTAAVESILFGPHGLSSTLRPGSLVIDMGTTAVTATRQFADRLCAKHIDFIDAPVSGGEIGAINGSLSIMAGGSADAIARAQPIFDVLGKATIHIGEVGCGQITKAANQIIVGLNIGAVAEALTLARLAGADLVKVREALMGGFAASRILEVHGQRMIDATFQPGGKVTTQHKDLTQAIELAAEYRQQLPASELNRALYSELIAQGQDELDHSALILALEKYRKT